MILFVVVAAGLAIATSAVLAYSALKKPAADGPVSRTLRIAAVLAAGLAPLAATGLYFQIGDPQAVNAGARAAAPTPQDEAAAIAAMSPDDRRAVIENMVSGLADRLEADPDDLAGWRMLARSYAALERYDESADAWREALVRSEGDAEDWRGLAMALVEKGRGGDASVGPAVREAFDEVLLQKPDDPMALYFLGFAAEAEGDHARAVDLLSRLRAQVPDDAPLAAELDAAIAEPQQSVAPPEE